MRGESFLFDGGHLASVREAQWDDFTEVLRLHRQASEFHGRLDPGLAPGSEDLEKFRKAVQRMLGRRRHRIFVAEESRGEGLVGYAMGQIVDNRPFALPEFGYVGCLHADEAWRAQGIGRALSVTIHEWFKAEGLDVAQVDVPYRNPVAQRFWERRGFTNFLDHLWCETEAEVTAVVEDRVLVGRAQIGHVDAVLALWKEMMDYHARIDRRLRVCPDWRRHVERSVRRWLKHDDTRLLVAQVGHDVIGFALGGIVDVGLGLRPGTHGSIAHLCVEAEWRRRGVGRQLFASLRDLLQEQAVSSIHVYVSRFNSVSQSFWRSLGFEDYIERLWCDLA